MRTSGVKVRFWPETTREPAGGSPAAVLSEKEEPFTEAGSIGSENPSVICWFCAISVMLHPVDVQPRLHEARQNLETADAQLTLSVDVAAPPPPQPARKSERPTSAETRRAGTRRASA